MSSYARSNIYDVAKEARVSIATVSRVLNNSPIPTAKTRERVLRAMHELNYQPDPAFRQAFRRRNATTRERPLTQTIGYMMDEKFLERALREDGYYSRVLAGIQQAVRQHRYHLMWSGSETDMTNIPAMVAENRVDGVLLEGNFSDTLRRLLVQRLPVVFVDRSYPELGASSTITNVERAVEEELEYLWELGHRNIVTFLPMPDGVQYEMYQHAFQRFFKRKQHALEQPALCAPRAIVTETHARVMEQYARDFAAARPRPTALIAYDVYACTLLEEFHRLGVRVPDDVSVVGMDDMMQARMASPQLTSYRFPMDDMGRTAVELLIQKIQDPARAVHHVLINGQMVERASCARGPVG